MDFVRILNFFMYFYRGEYTARFLIIAASVYVVLFVFGGIGLYKLASRQGLKHKWRAFVPFANSNLMGKLVEDECTIFSLRIKHIKIWIVITEAIAAILGLAVIVCTAALYSDYFADVRDLRVNEYGIGSYKFSTEDMTNVQRIIYGGYYFGHYIWYVFDLLYFVFYISAVTYLFRRYVPAQYAMFTILCIFLPIEGIFIFAIRNRQAVNYREYVRARMARYRSNNPYGNPYRRNYGEPPRSHYNYDPYTGKPINHNGSENTQSSGDPFPEFDGDNNKSASDSSSNQTGGGNDKNGSSSDSSNPFEF